MTPAQPVRLGLTLPSFQADPDRVLAVARAAEEAGVDGVFAFDHLFRRRGDPSGGERRPALELTTTLAAVAAETSRVTVGTLVARATLRPPATLRAALDTLARIAPGRLVAGVGGGDEESAEEDHAFGIDVDDRMARLSDVLDVICGRGYPVWVGGASPAVARLAAARSDGWNLWGGGVDRFSRRTREVRHEVEAAGRDPGSFTFSWGGLAVVAPTRGEAEAKRARLGGDRPGLVCGDPADVAEAAAAYGAAGAAWVVLGPIDSSDPDNAHVVGEAARILAGIRSRPDNGAEEKAHE